MVALTTALLAASPGAADTLAGLVQSAEPGTAVRLPSGVILGRADIGGATDLRGAEGTVLSAPEDDAILAVLPGAELHLSGVTLRQDGVSRFAIYIDGGRLELADCRIEGAFEVAVYVAAGSLSLRDCEIDAGLHGIQAAPGSTVEIDKLRMSGQGDTAIRADGSALRLRDVTIANAAKAGIVVVSPPEMAADGVTVSDSAGNGLWVQDAATADLTRITVQVAGQAMAVSGGGALQMDGVYLQGSTGALTVDQLAGEVVLTHARLAAGDGATVAVLSGVGAARMRDVDIAGGETGLYLTGAMREGLFDRVLLQAQASTGLFVDAVSLPEGAAPLRFANLRAIGAGAALPAYFRDSGPVAFTQTALVSAGALPFGLEGASAPEFRDSALISAPDWPAGHIAFAATPGEPPGFLPVGDLALLETRSIGPGTVQLSLAEFAESTLADAELRRAVAGFALGTGHDPAALALALEYALPVARDGGAAPAMAEVRLEPPEAGWVWDAEGAQISLTGAGGETVSAGPGDFPLILPVGDYSLAVDGRAAGRVSIARGTSLHLPLPEAPFYAWRDAEGQRVRGPALYLRPKDELAALLAGLRPLRLNEFWGYAPVFAPRRGADRQMAAEIIAAGRDELPGVLAEMAELHAAEKWADFNRRWQHIDMTLDIMAQFGTAEDAQWLSALAVPEPVQIDNLETAALIEMRLGLLDSGVTLTAARANLASYLGGEPAAAPLATRLVRALARAGLPEGQTMLADLHRALRAAAPNGLPVVTGLLELSRQPPAVAGEIPTAYLDQLGRDVERYLAGSWPEGETAPIGIDLWTAAAMAMAHEVVHGLPGAARRLPIPVAANIGPSAWAFADPGRLMGGPLASIGPPEPQRLTGWTYRMPEYLCAALAYRTPADRQSTLDSLRQQTVMAVTSALIPEAEEGDPARVDRTQAEVRFALDLILGECVLSDAVLQSHGRDAAGEEQAIFDQLDYEPLWWQRRPRSRALLEGFVQGVDFPTLAGHSTIPLADLETMLGPEGGDPALRAVFLARHRLISDAFQSNHDSLSFGAERRQFRLRNEGGNGSVTIAGQLDIRPVLSAGRMIVAIRHNIRSPDYGGLAAMITEPDRAPFEAENRIRMFEAVTLDRGGVETAMVHEGTSAAGVHFFAAPWSGDLSDTALHLSMRFWDATWELDLPLWSSALALGRTDANTEAAP